MRYLDITRTTFVIEATPCQHGRPVPEAAEASGQPHIGRGHQQLQLHCQQLRQRGQRQPRRLGQEVSGEWEGNNNNNWSVQSEFNSFREFKPREQTAEIVKIPETEEDTKKPVETRFDETENGSQADNEDKFKRTKSTKSNKSLTLPLDPVKRKDSGASSRDFSTVTITLTHIEP